MPILANQRREAQSRNQK